MLTCENSFAKQNEQPTLTPLSKSWIENDHRVKKFSTNGLENEIGDQRHETKLENSIDIT